MYTHIHPKLPMRNSKATKAFYIDSLGFKMVGTIEYDGYLMLHKDSIEIHFFEFKDLNPKENYGQVYIRTNDIDNLYQSLVNKNIPIHPNGHLQIKPWNQKEFSLLDTDNNLITFGQQV